MRWRSPLVLTGGSLLVVLSIPSVALAATAPSTTNPPTYYAQPAPQQATPSSQASSTEDSRSAPAPLPRSIAPSGTQPYAMDFTLPTLGKSGCMVCHADRNLIRIKGDQYVSYYIPDGLVESSVHGPGPKTGKAGVLCTGCHVDFASTTPHKNNGDWQRTAKNACRACHTLEDDAFGKGAHSIDNRPGHVDPKAAQKPLCGDCHGGHEIKRLDAKGSAELHRNGWTVCGRCHRDEWASYADYYHGAAYTRGAPDAPACWDCHGAHETLPSDDRRSPTNPANLKDTCSGSVAGKKCHTGVNDQFVGYSGLIHRRVAILDENPLFSFMHKTQTGISAALSNIAEAVRSWFT